jgi:hypothetical protein
MNRRVVYFSNSLGASDALDGLRITIALEEARSEASGASAPGSCQAEKAHSIVMSRPLVVCVNIGLFLLMWAWQSC